MTTPTIKIKVTPKNVVKGKMDVRFPARVEGGPGIVITKVSGTYTVTLDYPTSTSLGGVKTIDAVATKFLTSLGSDGAFTAAQPAFTDISGVISSSQLDTDLAALADNSTNGLWARTGSGTGAARTLTAPAAGITVSNGDGVSGNPTLALANDLAALEGISGTNVIPYRSAADTWGTVTVNGGLGFTAGTLSITDAELTAIAGLTSAADRLPYFTGSGTAALATFSSFARTLVDDADAATARTTLGLVIGTNVQAYDADLAALAANASTGLWAVTGAGTGAVRTITAPAAGITVSNGSGAAGNPTLALANDLSALEGLSSTGIARRTGTDTWTVGTAVSNSELATMTDGTVKANVSGSTATPSDVTITALLDKLFGTTQGSVVYRGASAWAALGPGTSGYVLKTQGAAANPAWAAESGGGGGTAPTVTVYTSGSGTHTTAAGCTWMSVELVGGGAGGAGGGSGGGNGTDGGDTTFGSLTAGGGKHPTLQVNPGAVGSASGGDENMAGTSGGGGGASTVITGGAGGSSTRAGCGVGGAAGASGAGTSAATNSGSGGGGGTTNNASYNVGAGGSSGATVRKVISVPSSSYSYAVGAAGSGGAAGTAGTAGGAGAAGIIVVKEYF